MTILFQDEPLEVDRAAEAAQKLGDISSDDEGVVNENAAYEAAAGAGAGGCDFDMVTFFSLFLWNPCMP